jgi:hypothetical protein
VTHTDIARNLPRIAPPARVHRRLVATATALLVVAIGILALRPLQNPRPARSDAPATEFSAARARSHIAAIAGAPRPTGSPGAVQARGYLTQTLTGMGLTPRTTTHPVCRPTSREASCGQVSDVWATIPGRRGAGTVVLVSHYDSVVGGPGASDDGSRVATELEIARAVTKGRPLDNNLMLLFTEGEEPGMLGSRAAVQAGELPDPAHSVVINLESRGPSGPAIMFETGDRNGGTVDALKGRPPLATSVADTVFRLLPNDSDFAEFRRAGFTGMNFASIAGSARYDNALDDVGSVDLGTLQDVGGTVLSAVHALGDRDLASVTGSGRVTYFPVLGWLVSYPQQVATVLCVLALLAVVAALWFARRRGAVRLPVVGLCGAALPAAAVVGLGLGMAGWRLILLARPDYVGFVLGDPYRPGLRYLGFALVAVAVAVTWWGLSVRRATAVEVSAAVTAFLGLCAVVCLFVAPGVAYVPTWPALAGAVALAVAAGLSQGSLWRAPVLALPGVAAVVVLVPVVAPLFPALGLAAVGVPLAFVVLLGGALLTALPRPGRRTLTAVVAVLMTAGVTVVAVGTALDHVDARHPRQVSLIYARDADTGAATWLSPYPVPDRLIDHYVRGRARPWTAQFPFLLAPRYRSGAATPVTTAAPAISPLKVTAVPGGRRLRLRLAADSPTATALALYVDTTAAGVVEARVAGQRVAGGVNRPRAEGWRWGFTFAGPVAAGVEVELTVTGTAPVRLRVIAQAPGLPAQAMDAPMPATMSGALTPAVQTVTARTAVL